MTDASDPRSSADELDGHTLDELADYLERRRRPFDPDIESSPACRIALAGLERLRTMTDALLDLDAAAAPADDRWIENVLGRISLESRAGRRFPLAGLPAGTEAVVTEGALRGLVRAIGDSIPGVVTGRVRFRPDDVDALIDLDVEIGVLYGTPIGGAAAEFRRRIAVLLPLHAPFAVRRLDVRVRDVFDLDEEQR